MTHFIIIGSTRCGTTSLYNYLGAHPQINLAKGQGKREVHFFDYENCFAQGIDWYWAQFKENTTTGETSPTMLQHYCAPERLKRYIDDCRLIVLLRNPIDRAYSDYYLAVRKGWTNRTFRNEVATEESRLNWELETPGFWKNHFYLSEHHLCAFKERGMYAKHLKRWFEYFPRDQFLIVKSESFFSRPDVVTQTAWNWLGLDLAPFPKFRQWQKAEYPAMSAKMRQRLAAHFEQPNRELQEITTWMW